MVAPSVLRFIGLNLVRVLSVCSLILVFCSVIDVMVLDGKAAAAISDAEYDALRDDCEYLPDSDIPIHVWGLFWAQLNRVFILCLTLTCICSELNWGGLAQRFFEYNIPILGASFSTAPLGIVQMMIGASQLSHYLWLFPLVSAWLLFVSGMLNLILGTIFRARGKDIRSILARDRERARQKEVTWRNEKSMSNVPGYKPTKRASRVVGSTKAALGQGADKVFSAFGQIKSKSARKPAPSSTITRGAAFPITSSAPMPASNVAHQAQMSNTSLSADGFPSLETVAHADLLRQRAREANIKAEQEEELREAKMLALRKLMSLEEDQEHRADADLERGLHAAYGDDDEAERVPLQRSYSPFKPPSAQAAHTTHLAPLQLSRADSHATRAADIARGQAGASADLEPWSRKATSPRSPRSPGRTARRAVANVRKRSLVLSRALKDLKITAGGTVTAKEKAPPTPRVHYAATPSVLTRKRRPRTPTTGTSSNYQSATASGDVFEMQRSAPHHSLTASDDEFTDDDEGECIMVGPPPLPSYNPAGHRIAKADVEDAQGATLPIASTFASEWNESRFDRGQRYPQQQQQQQRQARRHIPSTGTPF